MKRKIRILSFFVGLLLFCISSLQAEVYTIDFNKGTVSGLSVSSNVEGVDPSRYCTEGSELFTLNSKTGYCYYNDKGCGIRIAAKNGNGRFVISLQTSTFISKVVAYASKVSGNSISTLTFFAGDVEIKTFGNDELKDYSADNPTSIYYQLPDIIVNREFRNLYFRAPEKGYVMLHRIDIYTGDDGSEDAILSPKAFVDEMDVLWNLAGQRISKPSHGIFIKGGRKYVAR